MNRALFIVSYVTALFLLNDWWTAATIYLITGEILAIIALHKKRPHTVLGTIFYIIYWAPVFIKVGYERK